MFNSERINSTSYSNQHPLSNQIYSDLTSYHYSPQTHCEELIQLSKRHQTKIRNQLFFKATSISVLSSHLSGLLKKNAINGKEKKK